MCLCGLACLLALVVTPYYWSCRMYMRGRELSTLVVILSVYLSLSVCLSSREFTFRSSNLNIACSTATSLSPLMEKVYFYRNFVSGEPRRYRKSRKLEKPFFGRTSLKFHFRRSIKGLKICQHIIFKTYV